MPTPRIYLFFPAIVLKLAAAAVSGMAFVENSGVLWISGLCLWLLWFGLLFFIAQPNTDYLLRRYDKPLRTVSIAVLVVLLLVGIFEAGMGLTARFTDTGDNLAATNNQNPIDALDRSFAYNDAIALCHQAIDNALAGLNPYAAANIILAGLQFNIHFDRITPLQTGRFTNDFPYPAMAKLNAVWDEAKDTPQVIPPEIESRLAYPAGCFLLPLPFFALGISDLRWVYLLLLLPVLVFVVLQARGNFKWWLAGGLLASLEVWNSIAAGETGVLVVPFLLLAWVLIRRNLWVAAFCLGLAVATKQIAWFFVPFFIILVMRTVGLKKAVLAVGVVGMVFLAVNIPYITMDVRLWFSSVLSPMGDQIFPLGVGLVSLVTGGYWHMDNPLLFGFMELFVGLVGLIWYYFHCKRAPCTALVLAVLPIFFAWRSLWEYFFYIDIILLAMVIICEYGAHLIHDKNAREDGPLAITAV